MKPVFYSATDIGPVRQSNQDSILTDGENRLFIVADGMGGHQGGEVASKMVVNVVAQGLAEKAQKQDITSDDIREIVLSANKTIYDKGQKNINLRGMGTTLCFLVIDRQGRAYIVNIGDSRVYMEKDGKMWLLTEDHNFMTNQVKACFLSGEALPEPSSEDHVLTRSVGFFPMVEPDIFEKQVEKGEKYLICSDGLSGFVPYEDIHAIVKNTPLKDIPAECVEKAKKSGSDDNISVIVIEIQ